MYRLLLPPPPHENSKRLLNQHSVLGHYPPVSKTPGPLPLNPRVQSFNITVNGCLLLLVCVFNTKVDCCEIVLSTQALELLCSTRPFKNVERQSFFFKIAHLALIYFLSKCPCHLLSNNILQEFLLLFAILFL